MLGSAASSSNSPSIACGYYHFYSSGVHHKRRLSSDNLEVKKAYYEKQEGDLDSLEEEDDSGPFSRSKSKDSSMDAGVNFSSVKSVHISSS